MVCEMAGEEGGETTGREITKPFFSERVPAMNTLPGGGDCSWF